MLIRTSKKQTDAAAPRTPGLLIGVENPSPALAAAAMSTLGLASPPRSLLLAIPPRALASTPLENAVNRTAIGAAKLISKELARSAPPLVQRGVDLFWLGVNVANLYEKWQGDRGNIAALVIDSASAIADGVFIGQKMAGFEGGLIGSQLTSENLGMVFTQAGAAAKGRNISMALLNKTAGSTPYGKILGLASPIVQAALSTDPAWSGYKFAPFPDFETPDHAG